MSSTLPSIDVACKETFVTADAFKTLVWIILACTAQDAPFWNTREPLLCVKAGAHQRRRAGW